MATLPLSTLTLGKSIYARKKPEKRSRAPSISARGKNGKGAASLAYARWKIG